METWSIAFSPDGKYLASTGQAGNINIWGTETGKKEQVLAANGKFTMSVAFVSDVLYQITTTQSPNGKYVACGAMDGVVSIFDVIESKRLHAIEGMTVWCL